MASSPSTPTGAAAAVSRQNQERRLRKKGESNDATTAKSASIMTRMRGVTQAPERLVETMLMAGSSMSASSKPLTAPEIPMQVLEDWTYGFQIRLEEEGEDDHKADFLQLCGRLEAMQQPITAIKAHPQLSSDEEAKESIQELYGALENALGKIVVEKKRASVNLKSSAGGAGGASEKGGEEDTELEGAEAPASSKRIRSASLAPFLAKEISGGGGGGVMDRVFGGEKETANKPSEYYRGVFANNNKQYVGMFMVKKMYNIKSRLRLANRASNDEVRAAVKREADIMSTYRHRNIIRFLGYSFDEQQAGGTTLSLSFEYADRGGLNTYIDSKASPERREILNWKKRIDIAYQISDALRFLQGYSQDISGKRTVPYERFRDLRSSNFSLTGSEYTPKLMDCGFGKFVRDNAEQSGGILGFFFGGRSAKADEASAERFVLGGDAYAGYNCDEYKNNKSEYDEKSEVFSFGILLSELLTGKQQQFEKGSGLRREGYIHSYNNWELADNDSASPYFVPDARAGNWRTKSELSNNKDRSPISKTVVAFRSVIELCIVGRESRSTMKEVCLRLLDLRTLVKINDVFDEDAINVNALEHGFATEITRLNECVQRAKAERDMAEGERLTATNFAHKLEGQIEDIKFGVEEEAEERIRLKNEEAENMVKEIKTLVLTKTLKQAATMATLEEKYQGMFKERDEKTKKAEEIAQNIREELEVKYAGLQADLEAAKENVKRVLAEEEAMRVAHEEERKTLQSTHEAELTARDKAHANALEQQQLAQQQLLQQTEQEHLKKLNDLRLAEEAMKQKHKNELLAAENALSEKEKEEMQLLGNAKSEKEALDQELHRELSSLLASFEEINRKFETEKVQRASVLQELEASKAEVQRLRAELTAVKNEEKNRAEAAERAAAALVQPPPAQAPAQSDQNPFGPAKPPRPPAVPEAVDNTVSESVKVRMAALPGV